MAENSSTITEQGAFNYNAENYNELSVSTQVDVKYNLSSVHCNRIE